MTLTGSSGEKKKKLPNKLSKLQYLDRSVDNSRVNK